MYTKNNLKDISSESIIRKSSKIRIIGGTILTTSICTLYAVSVAKYRTLGNKFILNWLKGSLIFSFGFLSLNECIYSLSKYYNIYNNIWIGYSISGYLLSKMHYRRLIRYHNYKWYSAILYSHKCFASLTCSFIVIDYIIDTLRLIYLYDEDDIFDIYEKMFRNNKNITLMDIKDQFMKPIHIINSEEKKRKISEEVILYKELHPKNKLDIVDLYGYLYRN